MANHSHFNLQLFADEGTPAAAARVLDSISETPIGADGEFIPTDTPKPEVDEPNADAAEPNQAEVEEFDEIIYNKETLKIPVSQRQELLQKGYNYDKVHGKLTEHEAKMESVNKWVKENYGDQGINTWEEYQVALQTSQRQSQLEEMGLDEDSYNQLLESDPKLQQLRGEAEALKKQAQDYAVAQKLQEEVNSLNETYGLKLESIDDISSLPNAEKIIDIARNTGLPLADCYLLANRDELQQKQAAAAAQRVRNQAASKSHVKDTTKVSDSVDLVQVPADVFAMYKQLNPNASEREIREHYARSKKE